CGAKSLGRAARHAHVIGADVQPLVTAVVPSDRFAERRQPARRRILVRTFPHRPSGSIEDFVRPAEIGKALPEVHRAKFGRQPGHALENAGLHLLVDWVHRARIARTSPRCERAAYPPRAAVTAASGRASAAPTAPMSNRLMHAAMTQRVRNSIARPR